jgi:hypothetical protein
VFDWTVTCGLDSSTHSITLSIAVTYDHMEVNNALAVVAGVLVGLFTGGIAGLAIGTTAGIAVGKVITNDYTGYTNNLVLDTLGGKWGSPDFLLTKPVPVTLTHPTDKEFILTGAYHLTDPAWNGLMDLLNAL